MKITQKLPRNSNITGQICSVCFHAVSNHNIEVDTKDPSYTMTKLKNCLVCNCRKCAW